MTHLSILQISITLIILFFTFLYCLQVKNDWLNFSSWLSKVSNTLGNPGNLLELFYWKSWNSTGILPGLLEISWCCGICSWFVGQPVIKSVCCGRNIQWNRCRNLVEIRSKSHEAVFDVMKDGKSFGQTDVVKVCDVFCIVRLIRSKFMITVQFW